MTRISRAAPAPAPVGGARRNQARQQPPRTTVSRATATAQNQSQLTVVVRARPMNANERSRRHHQCVFPVDEKRLLLVDPEKYENNILRQNRQHEREFAYDYVFGPSSSQEEVHAVATEPLVQWLVDGYNGSVFAYGATGSGKTHTMIGTKEKPGLMTLLTLSLYEKIHNGDFQVYLSFLEVYNEIIRDLLNPNGGGVLELMEDERGNVRVPGLSSVRAPDTQTLMDILEEGTARRTQEATMANKTSSRSHALLQVALMKGGRPHAKLFLIDLAGSERASHTQNTGLRLKEGAAINKSLLALGNVINSLSNAGNRARYVNYRDSKLTRLLKDSLGGNSKTCMIAHVTPSSISYEETFNTLLYAARAMNISTKPTRNRPSSADGRLAAAIDVAHRTVRNQRLDELTTVEGGRGRTSGGGRQQLQAASSLTNLAAIGTTAASQQFPNRASVLLPPPSQSLAPRHILPIPKRPNTRKDNVAAAANGLASATNPSFAALKEQFVANQDKLLKLKEQLLRVNRDCYEIDIGRTSKIAILQAWERQANGNQQNDGIQRLRLDVDRLNEEYARNVDEKRKVEGRVAKCEDAGKQLEAKIRAAASNREQRDLVDLLVKMGDSEQQRLAMENDLVVHDIIMRRADTSFAKLQKFEALADRLIEGHVDGVERDKLEQEYRVVKNQFHYHLIPLQGIHDLVTKQRKNGDQENGFTDDLSKTYVTAEFKKKRSSVQLPTINDRPEPIQYDTQSETAMTRPVRLPLLATDS